jgi:hypothetical protein
MKKSKNFSWFFHFSGRGLREYAHCSDVNFKPWDKNSPKFLFASRPFLVASRLSLCLDSPICLLPLGVVQEVSEVFEKMGLRIFLGFLKKPNF